MLSILVDDFEKGADVADQDLCLPKGWILKVNVYQDTFYVGLLRMDPTDNHLIMAWGGMNFYKLLEKWEKRLVSDPPKKKGRNILPNKPSNLNPRFTKNLYQVKATQLLDLGEKKKVSVQAFCPDYAIQLFKDKVDGGFVPHNDKSSPFKDCPTVTRKTLVLPHLQGK